MPDPISIIGAGPAGLATAACLARRGVAYRILDRSGEPGGAYRCLHGAITLASPASFDALPGLSIDARTEYITIAEYLAYLRRYAAHHRLTVERAVVERVERTRGGFSVRTGDAVLDAAAVVVATGMWDFPVRPDVRGADGSTPSVPVLHARDWTGPDASADDRVLVLGGGASAVEIAEHVARAGQRAWVCARSGLKLAPKKVLGLDVHHWVSPIERLPPWLARPHCRMRATLPAVDCGFSRLRDQGLIRVVPAVSRYAGDVVRFADGSAATVDRIVLATGYRFDTPFLPPEVAREPGGHLRASAGESTSWRGLFVVGAPCAARIDSDYLRGIARDVELVAERLASRAR